MSKTVLITGASGLIGKPLTERLIKAGYAVHQLSRNMSKANKGAKIFKWDPAEMYIDPHCIDNVSVVINLAGEGIADRPWTNNRKQQIIKSRTGSIKLLYDLLKSHPNHGVTTFISSSAVGHYGDRKDEILSEESEPGTDFLANTCLAWERAADKIDNLGLRLVIFRTGVVLTREGGALPKIAKPIKLGLGAPLGSGKQWLPWIHIDDAVSMFLYAIENEEIAGIYNMASPFPATNKTFTQAVARQIKKPLWLPSVPALFLRVVMGEMSRVVLNSNKTTSDKIVESGFKFKYPKLEAALTNIYG
ncbi:TIGR01777 family oxidoreductase [Paradesertivirga mongoliensis]|uniref:TIGR01777 family oxidoreductase n=1 Tax=Paradesertivirga mongoliensis TaxID=2100740 RepID=A0ABW4ZJG3_9SPHI|nr:TIGR01777 family oxidoreductase [Pedobacter mongoliensis]